MQHVQGVIGQTKTFIHSQQFFSYHGLVLSLLWFFAAPIGILCRKLSRQLHAACFFLIDVTTIFFVGGAGIRVFSHIEEFPTWTIIKQGHVIAGALFLVLLVLQHLGGVITLLKGMNSNPIHRKFGLFVSNLGRVIAIFGLILAKQRKEYIYAAIVLAVVLLIASILKASKSGDSSKESKAVQKESKSSPTDNARPRSPPRDVKRD